MYKNIGKKIENVAIGWFILTSLSSILLALFICDSFTAHFAIQTLLFIIIVSLGIFISWVISLFIYGFGRLIENSDTMVAIHTDSFEDASEFENTSESEADFSSFEHFD